MTVGPRDFHRGPAGSPFHSPFAMYGHLRRASKVRADHPDDLCHFLHGVVYLVRTEIRWRDLPRYVSY